MITKAEVQVIQQYWFSISINTEEIFRDFYIQLFLDFPQYKQHFRNDINVQADKLSRVINIVINGAEILDDLEPLIKELGRKHASIAKFNPQDYKNICTTLFTVMERYKGHEDTIAKEAWLHIFASVAEIMLKASNESPE